MQSDQHPPVLPYATPGPKRSSWLSLLILGLILSVLHFGLLICFSRLAFLLHAAHLPHLINTLRIALVSFPLYLLQHFDIRVHIDLPSGMFLLALNSSLYGFTLAVLIHWLTRRRMRQM